MTDYDAEHTESEEDDARSFVARDIALACAITVALSSIVWNAVQSFKIEHAEKQIARLDRDIQSLVDAQNPDPVDHDGFGKLIDLSQPVAFKSARQKRREALRFERNWFGDRQNPAPVKAAPAPGIPAKQCCCIDCRCCGCCSCRPAADELGPVVPIRPRKPRPRVVFDPADLPPPPPTPEQLNGPVRVIPPGGRLRITDDGKGGLKGVVEDQFGREVPPAGDDL